MQEQSKIKSALLRMLCAMFLCIMMIMLKFILKEEQMVEELCNYIASNIVFLPYL